MKFVTVIPTVNHLKSHWNVKNKMRDIFSLLASIIVDDWGFFIALFDKSTVEYNINYVLETLMRYNIKTNHRLSKYLVPIRIYPLGYYADKGKLMKHAM